MKFLNSIRNRMAAFALLAVAFVVLTFSAQAQTDMTGVISQIETYLDAAIAVGIAVLLYVLGKRVVRRLM